MTDIERVAQRLGMKPSEITDVVVVADGVLAQTHDGVWTLIGNDGELVCNVDGPDLGADDEADQPKKPAAKRRSRA